MKLRTIICAATAIACLTGVANADAIGLRLGGGSLLGAEVNYQRNMGAKNRLEIGATFESESTGPSGAKVSWTYLGAVGIYQWKWNIAGINGFNWYAGPGAAVSFGMWSSNILGHKDSGSDIYVNVGGQVGIEYDFSFPLLLSLDVRPMFGVLHDAGFGWGAGLGVRYTF